MLCNTGGMALAGFSPRAATRSPRRSCSGRGGPGPPHCGDSLRLRPWISSRLPSVPGPASIGSNLYVVLYASYALDGPPLALAAAAPLLHWVAIVTITLGLAADAYLSHSDKHGGRSNTHGCGAGAAWVLLLLMFVQAEALSSGLPVVGLVLADPAAAAEKAKKKKTESQLLLDDADAAAPPCRRPPPRPRPRRCRRSTCAAHGLHRSACRFLLRLARDHLRGDRPCCDLFLPVLHRGPGGGGGRLEFESYLVLAATNALHAAAFFSILDSLGAVASGVLKGVQMLVVFIASDLLFCAADRSECVTAKKSACVAVVFAGLVLYGWSGGTKPHRGSSAAGGGGAEGFCASNKRQDGPAAAVASRWGGGGGGGGGGRSTIPADAAGASGSAASSSSPATAAGAGGEGGGGAWP